jgi:hypothetical protein
MTKRGKKGALEMSFSMIFSVILIIAFVAAGFYVVKMFLTVKSCADTGTFYADLQTSITNAWKSPETSKTFNAVLPTDFTYACVINWSEDTGRGINADMFNQLSVFEKNFVLWPRGKACKGFEGIDLAHIDLQQMTSDNNPFCIKVDKGKVSIKIEKTINENLVRIENA